MDQKAAHNFVPTPNLLSIAMQRFLSTEKPVKLLQMGSWWACFTTTVATLVCRVGEERKPRLLRRKSWDSMKAPSASAAAANKYSVRSCQRCSFRTYAVVSKNKDAITRT